MRQGWLWLACMFAVACAAPRHTLPAQPFVSRFTKALAFVPERVDSLWLVADGEMIGLWLESQTRPQLEMRCGRDLEGLTAFTQLQTFEGVRIEDFGDAGVPASRRRELGEPSEILPGLQGWLRAPRKVGLGQELPATWTVIVEERFVVVADSVALLQDALTRRGDANAASLLALVDVPQHTVELMVRRLRPPARRPDRKPSPSWHAMVRTTAPVTFEWWGPESAPRLPGPPIHETRRGTPVWIWRQVDGEEDRMEQSAMWQLQIALTFGLMIFI